MLPIIVDIASQKLVFIGKGAEFDQRRVQVESAGGHDILFNPERMEDIPAGSLVFIAGLDLEEADKKASAARLAGALVNTHDVPALCDFHMPAQMRRGDVLFTVSTGGRSPVLSRLLRQDLEKKYGPEWSDYLDILAAKRAEWRAQGMSMREVAQSAEKLTKEEGWIK